jgi:hypothetical protein
MLTLVPARGGSKRIPRKNVKLLGDFPLILWTLFPYRDLDPVVSSDDDDIISVAETYGFRTLRRPDSMATDTASSVDVALHAMEELDQTSVLLLQPTTPFRSGHVVSTAINLHKSSGKPVVAMKQLQHAYIGSDPFNQPLQAPTGSCYVIGRDDLANYRTFLPPGFLPVKDTSMGCLDIDYSDEWEHAEALAVAKMAEMRAWYVSRVAV